MKLSPELYIYYTEINISFFYNLGNTLNSQQIFIQYPLVQHVLVHYDSHNYSTENSPTTFFKYDIGYGMSCMEVPPKVPQTKESTYCTGQFGSAYAL